MSAGIASGPVVSRIPPAIPVTPKPDLPLYSYQESLMGQPPTMLYIRDSAQANQMVGLLHSPIGFDMEWTPTWNKTKPVNHTALIQLADAHTILLLQISAMRDFPDMVKALLENPNVVKVGVAIRGDATKLGSERGMVFRSLVDLGHLAKLVDSEKWGDRFDRNMPGLARLCGVYLERTLPKETKDTQSNWEAHLTQRQQDYAANDAHSSLLIYERLMQLRIQMQPPPLSEQYLFEVGTESAKEREAILAEERKAVKRERRRRQRSARYALKLDDEKLVDAMRLVEIDADLEDIDVSTMQSLT